MTDPRPGDTERPRRPVEIRWASWGRDLVVGWSAPWGPSLARVVRGASGDRAATELGALVLGEPAAVRAPPELVRAGESLACAWIDARGAWVAMLEMPHDHVGATPATVLSVGRARGHTSLVLGAAAPLEARARALATAAREDGGAWLAVATPEGVRLGVISPDGRTELEAAPWVARTGATPRLALAEVRGQPILCMVFPGERELVIARRDGDRSSAVTHRLDAPIADIAVEVAGSRLALALLETAGARVSCAIADARGVLTERPVAQIDRYAGEHAISGIDGVSVVWVDDAFRLVARDADRRTAYVLPFLGPVDERVGTIARVPGPPLARFSARGLVVLAAEHDDDEGRLLVVRAKVDGTEAIPVELRLAPPLEVARERTRTRAHACCVEVARTLAGASYRDSALVAEAIDDGARLVLPATDQRLDVRFVDDREVLVSLVTHGAEARVPDADDSAFGRLARWVRRRLSREERTLAARERAWAERMGRELAGPAQDELHSSELRSSELRSSEVRSSEVRSSEVRSSEVRASSATGAALEVLLSAVPHPEVLARWTARVREELANGRHRAEPDAKAP